MPLNISFPLHLSFLLINTIKINGEKLFCLNTGKGQIRTAVDCGALAGLYFNIELLLQAWKLLEYATHLPIAWL